MSSRSARAIKKAKPVFRGEASPTMLSNVKSRVYPWHSTRWKRETIKLVFNCSKTSVLAGQWWHR